MKRNRGNVTKRLERVVREILELQREQEQIISGLMKEIGKAEAADPSPSVRQIIRAKKAAVERIKKYHDYLPRFLAILEEIRLGDQNKKGKKCA
jgi:hypothetical protein